MIHFTTFFWELGHIGLTHTSKSSSIEGTDGTLGLPPRRFANIGALFSSVMVMMEGLSLQASPSTCMGIVLDVTILADLHCEIVVPCPPA